MWSRRFLLGSAVNRPADRDVRFARLATRVPVHTTLSLSDRRG
ncbi:MAG: hypothetical protein AVDCRST_MAG61-1425 [uncultured Friedmanniella sp.]|uniref:Uncharacterized protein n=1 Tax=uncultured Friedmanniella sp. TaxID=335381 RepID=A0A6J4KK85_9ACTN|nr:MAG: hypothetical protein AVDCRST_MAG61-1425 [uncultured Friedmanniella sp.]